MSLELDDNAGSAPGGKPVNDTATRVAAAKRAGKALARLDGPARSALLRVVADHLRSPQARAQIAAANERDLARGRDKHAAGEFSSALLARLELNPAKLDTLVEGLEDLARAPELVGRRDLHRELDEGLILERQRWPLGMLGIVFEARPDAVVQIAGLAIKSGNAVALKGGREALETNRALVECLHRAIETLPNPNALALDPACICLLEDRKAFAELLELDTLVDLVIARGSSSFVRMIQATSKIPVMGHAEGLCHLYLHADAEPEMAARLSVDAKTSYPAACNAIETLLWHAGATSAIDASLAALAAANVRLRGCHLSVQRAQTLGLTMEVADESDWGTEWSDLVLSVRCVEHAQAAIDHIEHYGSGHTETIVARDLATAENFLAEIDAACIFHNASNRFADGYRFGLGAEVGISTGKLHDRGPVGVEGLLTHRWRLRGSGQITSDYGPKKRRFLHREIPLK